MNRRQALTTCALLAATLTGAAFARGPGIKVRFVITRTSKRSSDAEERTTYENAVLLKAAERYELKPTRDFEFALRPTPTGEGVRVEVWLRDLGQADAQVMTGATVVKQGRGGGIELGGSGPSYTVGLLVTSAELPKGAA